MGPEEDLQSPTKTMIMGLDSVRELLVLMRKSVGT